MIKLRETIEKRTRRNVSENMADMADISAAVKRFWIAVIFLCITVTGGSTVRYVKAGGGAASTAASATTWATACSDLQAVINASAAGDTIFVAAGTYKPNRKADATGTITNSNRANAFVLKSGVKIFGGFPANGSVNSVAGRPTVTVEGVVQIKDMENNVAYETILSGDFSGNDNYTNIVSTPLPPNHNNPTGGTGMGENAYRVVISAGDAGDARLDGFTVKGGYKSGAPSITVNGQTIAPYFGGCGILVIASSPTLAHLKIINNDCVNDNGGGIALHGNSAPTVTNLVIEQNRATSGGGISVVGGGAATFSRILVRNNLAGIDYGSGGGISVSGNSSVSFTDVKVLNNNVYGRTGSDDWDDGFGGGVSNYGCSPAYTNVMISGNTVDSQYAYGRGGGMYNDEASPTLTNVLISGNRVAYGPGGGIYNEVTASSGVCAPQLINATVAGNSSDVPGEIRFHSLTTTQVYNSIIWGYNNGTGYAVNHSNSNTYNVIYSYSLLQGKTTNSTNVISNADPKFASGGYTLQSTSPAIDKGLNSSNTYPTDLAGNNRRQGNNTSCNIDLGAYEAAGTRGSGNNANITVSGTAACSGYAATLTASATGASFKWYASQTSTTPLSSSATFTTPVLTQTTTYYLSVSGTNYCETETNRRKAVTVTVNPPPSAPSVSAVAAMCPDAAFGLTISSNKTGLYFKVYDAATNGNLLATSAAGANITGLTAPASSATWSVAAVDNSTGCESARTSVSIPVNPRAAVAAITAEPVTICSGVKATLTASASGVTNPVFKWYDSQTATAALGTGASFTTSAALTENKTYYVSVSGTGLCENATNTRKSVLVTVNPLPTAPTVSSAATCTGAAFSITATAPSPPGLYFNVYAAATGGNPLGSSAVGSGTISGLTAPSGSTTYYVTTVNNTTKCESARKAVSITVNPLPSAPTVTAPSSMCPNVTFGLTISSTKTGLYFKVYDAATGGNLLATSAVAANITGLTAPASTRNWYVTAVNNSTGCESTRRSVSIPVNAYVPASDITASGASICSGGTATLSASMPTFGPAYYKWYASQYSTTALGTASSFTTPALTETTTYYVSGEHTRACETAMGYRKAVTVTVKSLPSAPAAPVVATQCPGNKFSIKILSPQTGYTYRVYNAATSGTSQGSWTASDSTISNLTAPASSATWSVAAVSNGCESARVSVSIPVDPRAAAADITADPVTICSGTKATLTASASGVTNPEFNWYDSQTSTTVLGTGTSFTTPAALTANKTYYVGVSGTGLCENATNARKSVLVTVNSLPTTPTVNAVAACAGAAFSITATAPSPSGLYFNVYAAASGGTPLGSSAVGSGTISGLTAPTSSTTYYVTAVNNTTKCESARKAVSITVNPLPSAPTAPTLATQCPGVTFSITLTAQSGIYYRIYDAATGGTLLGSSSAGSGTISNLTAPASAATWSVAAVNNSTGCASARTSFPVTLNPVLTGGTIGSDHSVCPGGTPNQLTSSELAGGSSGTISYQWEYSTNNSTWQTTGSSSATNTTLSPGAITVTTYYRRKASAANYCNAYSNTVTVTVNPLPSAPTVTTPSSMCPNVTFGLTISSTKTGLYFKVYDAATGGNLLATSAVGANITGLTAPATTRNWYVTAVNNSTGCESTRRSVSIPVRSYSPANYITGSTGTSICSGARVTLQVELNTFDGGTIYWYTSRYSPNGTHVGTGTSYTTPYLTETTIYYLGLKIAGECESAMDNRRAITVTVKPLPSAPAAPTVATQCPGNKFSIKILSPQTGYTYRVYNAATSGTSQGSWTASDSTISNLTAPASSATWSVAAVSNGCESARVSVSIPVDPRAAVADITAEPVTICSGTKATLAASAPGVTNPVFNWYDSQTATAALGTGESFTTPAALTANKTYYVGVSGTGLCENATNARKSVLVTVNSLPTTPTVSAVATCAGAAFSITATAPSPSGLYFNVYDAASGGTPLGSSAVGNGTISGLTAPTSSTTYYVTAVNNTTKCESARKAVSITVNQPPSAPAAPTLATQCPGVTFSITLTAQSGIYYRIYDAASGGTLLGSSSAGSGTISNLTAPENSATWSVAAVNNSTGCTSARTSFPVTIHPPLTGGTIGSNHSVCSGGTPNQLTSSELAGGGNGTVSYQWEYSTDNNTWHTTGSSNAANTTLSPGAITVTTYYRRKATNSCTGYSNTVLVTVNPLPTTPTVNAVAAMCAGAAFSITVSAPPVSGLYFNVYAAASGGTPLGSSAVGNGTISGLTAPTSSTTYYVTAVNNTTKCESTRKAVSITVHPTLTGGTIGSDHSVCSGGTPNQLTSSELAGGGNGTVSYQWEYSTDNNTWHTTGSSSAANTTLSPGAITATTYYRRKATNSCTGYSNTVTVTVNPLPTTPTVNAVAAMCPDATFSITVSAPPVSGLYFNVYAAASGGTPLGSSAVGNGTISGLTAPTSSTTYYVTAVNNTTKCESTRKAVSITVHPALTGGTVAANQTIVSGSTPAPLTSSDPALGGSDPVNYQWEQKTGAGNWENITNATTLTYAPPALTQPTQYRRRATSGICTAYSNTVTVLPVEPLALRYTACPGALVTLGFETSTSVTYNWYNDAGGSAGSLRKSASDTIMVTKSNASLQTFWVKAQYAGTELPDYRVELELANNCGTTAPQGCAATGTVIWKEDFGGNNSTDPDIKPEGLPQHVPGYTYLPAMNTFGTYMIGKHSPKPNPYPNAWYDDIDDHTYPNDPARGYFMTVNASATKDQFYKCRIDNLCSNAKLYFSVWLMSLIKNQSHPDKVNLVFELTDLNGNMLAEYYTGNLPDAEGIWKNYGFEFTVPAGQSSVVITIFNNGTGGVGNDPLLDDIEIRLCTPPVAVSQPAGTDTTVCAGSTFKFTAAYQDTPATFGSSLVYRWERNASGNINNPSEWTVIPNTDGNVNGAVNSTYSIPYVALSDTGYYRLAVANTENINKYNCRAMSNIIRLRVVPGVTPGTVSANQPICYNTAPNKITSAEPSGGTSLPYLYQWQQSNDGNNWKNAESVTGNDSLSFSPPTLTETTLYRLKITGGSAPCETAYSSPVTVTVLSSTVLNYPDISLQACPAVAADSEINLSKYVDTVAMPQITWSPSPAIDPSTGIIEANSLVASRTYTYTYTVSNLCVTDMTRKVYLKVLNNGNPRFRKDTIVVCYEKAEAIQINQIFGIDAYGKLQYSSNGGDISPYVKESATYGGAMIMNGKGIYEDNTVSNYIYHGTVTKKVEFTYTPSETSCLSGKTYKIVIILTPDVM